MTHRAEPEPACRRFRRREGWRLAGGMLVAAGIHVLFFLASPAFFSPPDRPPPAELRAVSLPVREEPPPPSVRVPPRPEPVAQPPPPPTGASDGEDGPSTPSYIPHDVPPTLINPGEVQEALQELYPVGLEAARVGGSVTLWLYVDGSGRVQRVRVQESSGFAAFDRAARAAAAIMEFSPALNSGKPTPVWVAQRIRFRVSSREPDGGARRPLEGRSETR